MQRFALSDDHHHFEHHTYFSTIYNVCMWVFFFSLYCCCCCCCCLFSSIESNQYQGYSDIVISPPLICTHFPYFAFSSPQYTTLMHITTFYHEIEENKHFASQNFISLIFALYVCRYCSSNRNSTLSSTIQLKRLIRYSYIDSF